MPEADRVKERREAGLCTSCGADAPRPGRAKCETCAKAAREAAAERRERAKRLDLCEACMCRKRAEGRGNRCEECADKYLASQLERAKGRPR